MVNMPAEYISFVDLNLKNSNEWSEYVVGLFEIDNVMLPGTSTHISSIICLLTNARRVSYEETREIEVLTKDMPNMTENLETARQTLFKLMFNPN